MFDATFIVRCRQALANLPQYDFLVLDTRYSLSPWLQLSRDSSLESVPAFCKCLGDLGQRGHIFSFAKANATRGIELFRQVSALKIGHLD